MRIGLSGGLGAVMLALSGCVGIESVQRDEGVVYFLPRTLLTLSVVRYRDTAEKRTWYQIGSVKKTETADALIVELDEIRDTSIPDPDHRYVAKYRPSAFSDDRLCMSRTPNGLLSDVNFASDDRTPQVVFNIARFIAGAIGGPRQTGVSGRGTETGLTTEVYTGRVDPLDLYSRRRFEESMSERFGDTLTLDVSEMQRIFAAHTAPLPTSCSGGHCPPQAFTDRCTQDNICYRTKLDVPIGLKRRGRHVDTNYAKVINPLDIGAISATRAFLVHKISKFKFDNGVLLGAVIRKPSEVEEASLLPLSIVYAALHTPSAALAAAFGGNSADKVKVATEIANLNAQAKSNADALKALSEGLSPAIAFNIEKETYSLTCGASQPSGTLINIGTGGKIE